jgi:hypothetical protein
MSKYQVCKITEWHWGYQFKTQTEQLKDKMDSTRDQGARLGPLGEHQKEFKGNPWVGHATIVSDRKSNSRQVTKGPTWRQRETLNEWDEKQTGDARSQKSSRLSLHWQFKLNYLTKHTCGRCQVVCLLLVTKNHQVAVFIWPWLTLTLHVQDSFPPLFPPWSTPHHLLPQLWLTSHSSTLMMSMPFHSFFSFSLRFFTYI